VDAWISIGMEPDAVKHMHDGGGVESPGKCLIGMPVLRCRRSSFIDGAGNDARYLNAHLASHPATRRAL
jgi:putative flavoprotein involved in K+ transport